MLLSLLVISREWKIILHIKGLYRDYIPIFPTNNQ